MKRLPIIFFLGFLAASTNTIAQTKADEEAVRDIPQAFCNAWNKHDGHELAPRYGMMVAVTEKRGGTWEVVVAQNTNAMLGIPPELQDIKTPIPIPGTDQKPQ
jgi:hypothetical protein